MKKVNKTNATKIELTNIQLYDGISVTTEIETLSDMEHWTYDTAKSVAIGIGVSGVVLYFILRYIAGKATGCLFRMLVKLIGFLLYTLGVGMLFITFLLEDQFKGLVGLERENSNVSTEEVQQQ